MKCKIVLWFINYSAVGLLNLKKEYKICKWNILFTLYVQCFYFYNKCTYKDIYHTVYHTTNIYNFHLLYLLYMLFLHVKILHFSIRFKIKTLTITVVSTIMFSELSLSKFIFLYCFSIKIIKIIAHNLRRWIFYTIK